MAFIRLIDDSIQFAPPEKAVMLWRIQNGEIKGTPIQRKFVERIRRIYLNRTTAPKSYLEKYPSEPYDSGPVRVDKRGKVIKRKVPVEQGRLPYID